MQILQQINPVSGTGIRTHDLLNYPPITTRLGLLSY